DQHRLHDLRVHRRLGRVGDIGLAARGARLDQRHGLRRGPAAAGRRPVALRRYCQGGRPPYPPRAAWRRQHRGVAGRGEARMSGPEPGARRPRGRPRSEAARRAILAAAGELMLSGGLAAATMDAIAARAGVSKATIYKWWPSRGAVALDGFLDQVAGTLAIPEGMTAQEALTWQLDALVRLFADTAAGPLMRALVAQAQTDPDIARSLRDAW